MLTPLFNLFLFQSVSYFTLALPMRVFGKTLVQEFPISVVGNLMVPYVFAKRDYLLGRRVACHKLTIIIIIGSNRPS